jgi:hypothetical protein
MFLDRERAEKNCMIRDSDALSLRCLAFAAVAVGDITHARMLIRQTVASCPDYVKRSKDMLSALQEHYDRNRGTYMEQTYREGWERQKLYYADAIRRCQLAAEYEKVVLELPSPPIGN